MISKKASQLCSRLQPIKKETIPNQSIQKIDQRSLQFSSINFFPRRNNFKATHFHVESQICVRNTFLFSKSSSPVISIVSKFKIDNLSMLHLAISSIKRLLDRVFLVNRISLDINLRIRTSINCVVTRG